MTEQEFRELVDFLEETPGVVRQLTASLSEREIKWKHSDGEFSALEQVCHLRDIERDGYAVRIGRLLAEDQPLLRDLDGSRLARERNYNSQDLLVALREFTMTRIQSIKTLRSLSLGQLDLSGVLEGVGEITLGGLLLLMHQHDQSHREELKQIEERFSLRISAENAPSKSDTLVR